MVKSKLFGDAPIITGDEDHKVLDDWFKQVVMLSDLLIPTSGEVLKKALCTKRLITYELMSREANIVQINKIFKELYALLTTKTKIGSKARSYVRTLKDHEGLEAWRLIKVQLGKTDAQKTNAEYSQLLNLPRMKPSCRNMPCLCGW